MRLGVFGGSFDPVHIGHLIAAEAVRQALALDRVLFVPSYQPPHKSAPPMAAAKLRLDMLKASVRDHDGIEVSDIEIRRRGVSYTVDTLTELKARYPASQLFLIVGMDLVPHLPAWRRWTDIARLATIVGVTRPGSRASKPPGARARPARTTDGIGRAQRVDIPAVDVSSTRIRSLVSAGKSIRYLVPEAARKIIVMHGLYKTKSRVKKHGRA